VTPPAHPLKANSSRRESGPLPVREGRPATQHHLGICCHRHTICCHPWAFLV
jgi:hypothetical protein